MGIMSFITNGLVETVGKVADELITSDEERLEKENERLKTKLSYELENKKMDIKEDEIYLEDRKSARDMNVNLIDSEDWLVRNTGSILAWVVVIFTFILDYLVIFDNLDKHVDNLEVLMFVLGASNTYVATVLNFYFGSSKTEADEKKKNIFK